MPWTTEQKIFTVEAYFRHWRCARLSWQCLNVWFSDEAHFLLSGHVNSKNNIFWGSTPPRALSANAINYSLWSGLPGLPSPNMASLDHSGSRTTTSDLWQSTPSDMSRYLASSGQHLVDGEGWSGPSSGSSRMVLPSTPQTNHWYGYSSVSMTDWSAADVTRSGSRIHRTWTPQIFVCGDTLRIGCMATTPRFSLTWRQQSQQQ